MSIIVLTSGWLIPAMVVHALIDISGAIVGFKVLSRQAVVRRSRQSIAATG